MALKQCKGCGRQLDASAPMCPGCGRPEPTGTTWGWGKVLGYSVVAGAAGLFVALKVMSYEPASPSASPASSVLMDITSGIQGSIERKVVEDAIAQYGIVKRSGSRAEACVHAGIVSAAYVQAKDEDGLRRWKPTEREDCRRAGMPQE